MRISEAERQAIVQAVEIGRQYGFENIISHLQTAWVECLMRESMTEESARRLAMTGRPMPFQMHNDILDDGWWDETGKRYEPEK